MKSFAILTFCALLAKAKAGPQYYGYALPSGYASATVNGIYPAYKPRTVESTSTLHQYYSQNAQPVQGVSQPYYPQPTTNFIYNPIAQSNPLNYYGQQPTYASIARNNIPVHQSPVAPVQKYSYKLQNQVAPVQPAAAVNVVKSAALVASDADPNELKTKAEEGFKLLDDLVQTVSEARGTAADSDPVEVNALKSIFPDIIDEVINQVSSYKGDVAQKDAFVSNSKALKQALKSAPTQSMISSIISPYVASLKEFTSKGFQSASS